MKSEALGRKAKVWLWRWTGRRPLPVVLRCDVVVLTFYLPLSLPIPTKSCSSKFAPADSESAA